MLTRNKYAYRSPMICRFLLRHGADVDHMAPEHYSNVTSTVLGYVNADLEILKLLLDAGCDPLPEQYDRYGDMLERFPVEVAWRSFASGPLVR